MGYTTEFSGRLKATPALNKDQVAYVNALASTRRMGRDVEKLQKMPDPLREAVGLPLGVEGEFCVGGKDDWNNRDGSIIDYNKPPSTQPGLWLQWVPSDNGKEIMWDGGEKFYSYVEWLQYLQASILEPWGIVLNGQLKWRGEDSLDRGLIEVKNGKIEVFEGESYKEKLKEIKQIKAAAKSKKELNKSLDVPEANLKISRRSKI